MREESSSSQNVNLCITSCQRGASQGTYKVFLEDGSSFFISIDFFLSHKLKKGLILDSQLMELIRDESRFVEAYIKAHSLLLRQRYTVSAIRTKLRSKDYDLDGIEKAIEKLMEQGLLDDMTFCEKWVESRLRNKIDSYNSLFGALMNKGISSNIIKEVLGNLYTDEIDTDMVKKSIDKYCRQGKNSDKIIKALINKGFSSRKAFRILGDREIE